MWCRLLGLGLCLSVGAFAQTPNLYTVDVGRWLAQDALNPPPQNAVLVIGSSSVRRWERLAADFHEYDIIQRGFGGSKMLDLLALTSTLVLPYDPAAIVVFEGTNDIAAGRTPAAVFQDWLSFITLVHAGQNPTRPPIPILFIAITPTPARWSQWPDASQVNAMVEAHAATDPSITYCNTVTPFLATGGPPVASLFQNDLLHLSQDGYDIWTQVIKPLLLGASPPTKTPIANPSHPPLGSRILFDFGPSVLNYGAQTSSPDIYGQHWNNWHAANGGSSMLAGQSRGDLLTTNGVPSGIDLWITGQFRMPSIGNGGLVTPDPMLLGDMAIGSATRDYFYSDDDDAPGGFMIDGLDPTLSYSLRFFAARSTSQLQRTTYRVDGCTSRSADLTTGGAGVGVTPGFNGNESAVALVSGVVPDRFGRIFIDLSRNAGDFAYVGVMELRVDAQNGMGQGNDPLASLELNGVGSPPSNGPFEHCVAVGSTVTLQWNGPPGAPYLLLLGPAHSAGTLLDPCIGILNLGTPALNFTDVSLLLDGQAPGSPFVLDGVGHAVQSFALPLPFSVTVQGAVLQPAPAACPLRLTAAHSLMIL